MKLSQRSLAADLSNQPAPAETPPDFLRHLQGRLGLDEPTAAEKLQKWLLTYQPGPTALRRAVSPGEGDETAAA